MDLGAWKRREGITPVVFVWELEGRLVLLWTEYPLREGVFRLFCCEVMEEILIFSIDSYWVLRGSIERYKLAVNKKRLELILSMQGKKQNVTGDLASTPSCCSNPRQPTRKKKSIGIKTRAKHGLLIE